MSYSLDQIKALGDAVLGLYTNVEPKYQQLLTSINSVDPTAPDAPAQLDALALQRVELKASVRSSPEQIAFDTARQDPSLFTSKASVDAYYAVWSAQATAILVPVNGPVLDAAIAVQRAAIANKPAEPAGSSPSGAPTATPKELTGAADDDKKVTPIPGGAPVDLTVAGATDVDGTQTITITGKKPSSQSAPDKPGYTEDRLRNPLSNLSSYTYQLTLYMTSPDAYNAFVASDRTQLNTPGSTPDTNLWSYVVAQSGGVNNSTSARAPGFELDYYIDDLRIVSAINGKETNTESNVTDLSFTIYEPYGFSFISKLKVAQDAINQKSNAKTVKGVNGLSNPTRQFYILGIRFQGYDKNGNLITASNTAAADNVNPAASGVYERFYDIVIKTMKFKLDGKMVAYNITAASVSSKIAYGMMKGRIDNDVPIVATTVVEALGGSGDATSTGVLGLLDTLNRNQQLLLTNSISKGSAKATAGSIEIANVYKLKFLGDADDIKNASLISIADDDISKWPMSIANKSTEINDAASIRSTPDPNKKQLNFKNGTSIMQAIRRVISQSSYLGNALTVIKESNEESQSITDLQGTLPSPSKKNVKWFNLGASVKCLGFDNKVNDFAYEITYIIQPYETPAALSVYAVSPTKYYGPHKRYEYWFTGKNSEIINYEQTLDNTYYNVALGGSIDNNAGGRTVDIPLKANGQIDGEKLGKIGVGMETQNSYVAVLKDPGNWATARITILGDPDFLMRDSPSSLNAVYNQFYSDKGYTVNPSGGHVFIEIDFKEANDYNNQNGLMTINQQMTFWKYPKSLEKKIKGVSYLLVKVVSNFSKGKFTQDLTGAINTFPGVPDDANTTSAAREEKATAQRDAQLGELGINTDLVKQNQNNTNNLELLGINTSLPTTGTQISIPTQTGQVADDDAAYAVAFGNPDSTDAGRPVNSGIASLFDE
jgi:hypothetical protein